MIWPTTRLLRVASTSFLGCSLFSDIFYYAWIFLSSFFLFGCYLIGTYFTRGGHLYKNRKEALIREGDTSIKTGSCSIVREEDTSVKTVYFQSCSVLCWDFGCLYFAGTRVSFQLCHKRKQRLYLLRFFGYPLKPTRKLSTSTINGNYGLQFFVWRLGEVFYCFIRYTGQRDSPVESGLTKSYMSFILSVFTHS